MFLSLYDILVVCSDCDGAKILNLVFFFGRSHRTHSRLYLTFFLTSSIKTSLRRSCCNTKKVNLCYSTPEFVLTNPSTALARTSSKGISALLDNFCKRIWSCKKIITHLLANGINIGSTYFIRPCDIYYNG